VKSVVVGPGCSQEGARSLAARRPEDDVGLRPTAFSDPPTVRSDSLAAEGVVQEPVAIGAAPARVLQGGRRWSL